MRRNEALSALTTFLNALKTLLLKREESKTKTLKAEADLPKSLTALLTKLRDELAVRRACMTEPDLIPDFVQLRCVWSTKMRARALKQRGMRMAGHKRQTAFANCM